jgi:hypothetical protein
MFGKKSTRMLLSQNSKGMLKSSEQQSKTSEGAESGDIFEDENEQNLNLDEIEEVVSESSSQKSLGQ